MPLILNSLQTSIDDFTLLANNIAFFPITEFMADHNQRLSNKKKEIFGDFEPEFAPEAQSLQQLQQAVQQRLAQTPQNANQRG